MNKDIRNIRNPSDTFERGKLGLGDIVERVTKVTGIKFIVEKFSEITGEDCGCEKRKDALNKIGRGS